MSRNAVIILAMVIFGLFASLSDSWAEDPESRYWVGGSGSWSDPSYWSLSPDGPGGAEPPSIYNGAYGFLTQNDDRYRNVYSSGEIDISHLTVDATGAGVLTLALDGYNYIDKLFVGYSGKGILNQNGDHHGGRDLILGYESTGNGIYNLNGGISGGAFLFGTIGREGTGILNQAGGIFLSSDIWLGREETGMGIYNLYDGEIYSRSPPIYTYEAPVDYLGVGTRGQGIFNQIGDSSYVSVSNLWLGMEATSSGTYNLSAGSLTVDNTDNVKIGWYGEGIFKQCGGELNVIDGDEQGNIIIADQPDSKGTYNLSGGIVNAGTIFNNDTLNYSGGELNAGIVNNGISNLSGDGVRKADGDIVNNGTFKATDTTAVYTGTFTNNGAYISDPSTQYFEDLIIGETGYLLSQRSDEFYISGDFINSSTMNYDWNTKHAYLGFIQGEDNMHDFYLTGEDHGSTISGYQNNFSWGTISINAENSLELFDGNTESGGALYVSEIIGAEIDEVTITNIISSDELNVYYMACQPGNIYLVGDTYDLTGGGQLKPIYEISPNCVLMYFDEFVLQGTIVGNGPGKLANRRLKAFRKKIVNAARLIDCGKVKRACKKLNWLIKRCDGSRKPKDFVVGPAVPELVEMIDDLINELECG